jgi:hypothetical protein
MKTSDEDDGVEPVVGVFDALRECSPGFDDMTEAGFS